MKTVLLKGSRLIFRNRVIWLGSFFLLQINNHIWQFQWRIPHPLPPTRPPLLPPHTHTHLFVHQTEARRAAKKFFGDHPHLSQCLDDRPLPPLSEALDPPLSLFCRIINHLSVNFDGALSPNGLSFVITRRLRPRIEKKNNVTWGKVT